MSKNSKNTSKAKGKSVDLDAPFNEVVLGRSEELAKSYHLMLEKHDKLGYTASCVEFPTVFADGKSPDECVSAIQTALTFAVATMIESGDTPPEAFMEEKREVQVNIRLTYKEKVLLSGASKDKGFRGLSDFIRTSVLEHIRCTG